VGGWVKYTSGFAVEWEVFNTHISFISISIGYTVSSRFSWGMRGGYFPVIIRAFVGIFFFGIQGIPVAALSKFLILTIVPSKHIGVARLSEWFVKRWMQKKAGLTCSIQAISAKIPGFAHMNNTIPLSSHITTNDLIGLLIW